MKKRIIIINKKRRNIDLDIWGWVYIRIRIQAEIKIRILTMLTRKIKTIKGNNELSNKRLPTLSKLKVSTEALKRKGK